MIDKYILNQYSKLIQTQDFQELKECTNDLLDYLKASGYNRILYSNAGLTNLDEIKHNFTYLESNPKYYKYALRIFLERTRLAIGLMSGYLYSISDTQYHCSKRIRREFPDIKENQIFPKMIFIN